MAFDHPIQNSRAARSAVDIIAEHDHHIVRFNRDFYGQCFQGLVTAVYVADGQQTHFENSS